MDPMIDALQGRLSQHEASMQELSQDEAEFVMRSTDASLSAHFKPGHIKKLRIMARTTQLRKEASTAGSAIAAGDTSAEDDANKSAQKSGSTLERTKSLAQKGTFQELEAFLRGLDEPEQAALRRDPLSLTADMKPGHAKKLQLALRVTDQSRSDGNSSGSNPDSQQSHHAT